MKKQEQQFGKVPPNAIEIEDSIIGALICEKEAFSLVCEFLKTECFYNPKNQFIYSAIKELSNENSPIDLHTVSEKLKKNGKLDEIGGVYTLAIMQSSVSSSSHLEFHARIVYQKYLSREVIRLSEHLRDMAYNEQTDIEDIISFANKNFSDISSFSENSILKIDEALSLMIENCEKNSKIDVNSSGDLIGFLEFDKRSGGLQKSDLIIIGAESSQGKTSFALSIANNISKNSGKIAIYSMEMRAIQIAARLSSQDSGIPANDILYGKFDSDKFNKLDKSISKLSSAEIYIDEKSTSSLDSIVSSIRGMVLNYGINGAIIDYIQLINTSIHSMNKEQQTALIARTLKNIAKDLNIWIIALSQLARDNSNPVPSIKRLRDSGQIEEAADVVMLIYRPEQVGRKEFPEPFESHLVENTAMIDVAKGRNIGTFKFLTNFEKNTTFFTEKTEFHKNEFTNKNFTENPF